MARRGSEAWKDNISLEKRRRALHRRRPLRSVEERADSSDWTPPGEKLPERTLPEDFEERYRLLRPLS